MAEFLILAIATSLAFGTITAQIARRKGYNPKTWFVAGMLTMGGVIFVDVFLRKRRKL